MDVEDEPNSYLKYLNDSDTPNTYLLGNNEVGLFSVEPIFTEMEATDWPQEGFPLLLNNSLITEDSAEDQDTSSQSSDKNLVTGPLHQGKISEYKQDNLPETIENSTDIKNMAVQDIIEIPLIKNEAQLDDNALPLVTNTNLDLGREHLQMKHENTQLNDSCTQLNDNCIQLNETNTQLHKNQLQNDDILHFNKTEPGITGSPQLHKNYTVIQIKPNEKYILVYGNNVQDGTSRLQLVSNSKTVLPNRNSLLKSVNLPIIEKRQPLIQKKTKSVNDLFSSVVANKCKVCAFLCEDLEQIKRHIGEKHREFLFTNKGISNGVSLLISNIQKKISQNNQVKKDFTVFVCSECHAVCTDKCDLKQHMIQVHHLTMEHDKFSNPAPEVKIQESKPVYKKTTFLSDVNISLVKKQEKAMQKVKCRVGGCTANFPTEDLCDAHTKLHLGDTKNLFKCQECEETFLMWRIARSHMHKEHGLDFGMIVCPMCSIFKSYKTAKILRHMMIHTEQKPFVCQDCEKSFKQLAQLKNHEILHKTPEDMPTWCKVKKCDKCQRFFANSKSLKSHILSVHENFKPFICNICGHKAARKAMLELHLRQHTGSKPHKCDRCTYRTGDPNCLRKHMMKHVGAVTYQCPYCPYRCIQAGSIKSHLKHKHKGRTGTFSCKYCPYTTINPTSLHSHEKNHEISLTEGIHTGASSHNPTAIERERSNETDLQMDEETQSCFLNIESQNEDTVDNGGVTIPAGLEMPLAT